MSNYSYCGRCLKKITTKTDTARGFCKKCIKDTSPAKGQVALAFVAELPLVKNDSEAKKKEVYI